MKKHILFLAFIANVSLTINAQTYKRFIIDSTMSYSQSIAGIALPDGGYVFSRLTFEYFDILRVDSNLQQVWNKSMDYYDQPWEPIYNPIQIFRDSLGNIYTPWSSPDILTVYSAIEVWQLNAAGVPLGALLDQTFPYYEDEPWRDINFDKIKNRILIAYDYDEYDPSTQALLWHETRFEVYDFNLSTVFCLRDTNITLDRIFVLYDNNDSQNYMLIEKYTGNVNLYDANGNFLWAKKYGSITPDGAVRKDSVIYFISKNILFKTDLSGNVTSAVSLQPSTNRSYIALNASGNLVIAYQAGGFIISEIDTALNIIQSIRNPLSSYLSLNMVDGSDDMLICEKSGQFVYAHRLNFNNYCSFSPYSVLVQPYSLSDSTLSPPSITGIGCSCGVTTNSYVDSTYSTVGIVCSVVSIPDIEKPTYIQVNPNPFSDEITVSVGLASTPHGLQGYKFPVEIKMFDVYGKEIISQPISNSKSAIRNLQNLAKGVYFVKVGSVVKKVIKIN